MQSTIRELLLRYRPGDALERRHHEAMLRLAGAEGDPCRRDHFEPGHFTASAFVLSPGRRELLLVFHEKLQRWLQPGGHLEAEDRDVESAARREVEEETGLAELDELDDDGPLFDLDVHEIPARRSEPAHLHHDLRFLFVSTERDARAGDGVSGARWVPLVEVPSLSADLSVRRVARKLEAMLGDDAAQSSETGAGSSKTLRGRSS